MENLRPRGIGEILDAAVALYKARFGALVALCLAVVVPVQVFNVLVTLSTAPSDVTFGVTGTTPVYDDRTSFWAPLAGTIAIAAVSMLAISLATAAVTRILADTYVGSPAEAAASDARGSARFAFERLPALLGASLVLTVFVVLGMAACFIGALWVQAVTVATIPVLLLERTTIGAAINRSVQLTKGRRWRAFSVQYLSALLASAVTFGLTLLIDVPINAALEGTGGLALAQGLSGLVTGALTVPFQAAAVIVLYFDMRVRAEGFDVQMALHRLDRAGGGAGATVPSIAAT